MTTQTGGLLTLRNVSVEGNRSGIGGGGIYVLSVWTNIFDSRILNNASEAQGGGIYNSNGSFVILDSLVAGNQTLSTGVGGGLASQFGSALVWESTFRDNRSATNGGGIAGSGISIHRSVIRGNSCLPSTCRGGGVQAGLDFEILNSTITDNLAGNGGGIATSPGADTLRLNNVTLAGNRVRWAGGGVYQTTGTEITFANTLIADNLGPGSFPDDCEGALVSAGHNLLETVAGCSVSGSTETDLYGVDPQLLPLGDHGGPTATMPLPRSSPAVDTASAEVPGASPTACEIHDQRGVERPRGGRCDIGAFELAALFRDGFESGDLTSWSYAVP